MPSYPHSSYVLVGMGRWGQILKAETDKQNTFKERQPMKNKETRGLGHT